MRTWGLTAKDVSDQCRFATNTIRMLGKQPFAETSLDEIEEAIEKARQQKILILQSAG